MDTKFRKNQISPLFKVERSNELNALSPQGMNLTDIRFLAIYQAKINARNPSTRVVTFKLRDFCDAMEIKELNLQHIKKVADEIICKPVHIPDGSGGMYIVPLFSKCHIKMDKDSGEWVVDIKCSEEVLPYMFEMKRNYFSYELWNALTLTSINQVRMYEILKQYEKIGTRTIQLAELKRLLGLAPNQYERFKDFRKYVIETCQKALKENTNITFTFELIKTGKKVSALKFNIQKNVDFKDTLRLKEFIKPEDLSDIMEDPEHSGIFESIEIPEPTEHELGCRKVANFMKNQDPLGELYQRCDKAYTMDELISMEAYLQGSNFETNSNIYNYIFSVYYEIKVSGNKVKNMYKYTMAILERRVNEHLMGSSSQKSLEYNYDLNEPQQEYMSKPRRMLGHCVEVCDPRMNVVAYIYENEFSTIRDGSWKKKYPNCSLNPRTNQGILVRDIMDESIPLEDVLYQ